MGVQSYPISSPGNRSTQYKGASTTSSSTDTTILSITGAGSLRCLHIYGVDANFSAPIVTVIVDGVTYLNQIQGIASASSDRWVAVDGTILTSVVDCDIKFKTSLVIKLKSFNNTYMVGAVYNYELA